MAHTDTLKSHLTKISILNKNGSREKFHISAESMSQ